MNAVLSSSLCVINRVSMTSLRVSCDTVCMTTSMPNTHPFVLEVRLVPNSTTRWNWTILRHGKVYQRSDRKHRSEADAREDGLEVIEGLLVGVERR